MRGRVTRPRICLAPWARAVINLAGGLRGEGGFEATLEKGLTSRWIIGSIDVAIIINSGHEDASQGTLRETQYQHVRWNPASPRTTIDAATVTGLAE
jgi:hypothetical protein